MHRSTEQVRDTTLDLVDATRHRASGLVLAGAQHVSTTLDKGAATLGDVVERLPVVEVAVERPRRTHRLRLVLLMVALGAIGFALARRLRQRNTDLAPDTGTGTGTGTEDLRQSDVGSTRLHVVPADGGGWDITDPDAGSIAGHHGTQAESVERATALLADHGGEIVIHGLDGNPRDTRRIMPA